MENIVDIVPDGFEMAILPVRRDNSDCNLMITYGCFDFQDDSYLKWQYYSIGDGLVMLNGQPPAEEKSWFLNCKVHNAKKIYTYGSRNVKWINAKINNKDISIIDLDLKGCPPIQILAKDTTVCNTYRLKDSPPCAARNVFLYKNWILNYILKHNTITNSYSSNTPTSIMEKKPTNITKLMKALIYIGLFIFILAIIIRACYTLSSLTIKITT